MLRWSTACCLCAPHSSVTACLLQAAQDLLVSSDPPFFAFAGAMISSAVSSALYLRDAAGEHTETRLGSSAHNSDAAIFYEWELRTRLRVVGKTGDLYIDADSKVCDGLLGDSFIAAQEVGLRGTSL